jgi:hypothetical protein
MATRLESFAGFSAHGAPRFDRRLTDKILAAFNHAYAAGDIDVAQRLHAALALAEDHQQRLRPPAGGERRGGGAIDQAGLWVAYVEARNSYHEACRRDGEGGEEAHAAAEAMKRAYRRWSEG